MNLSAQGKETQIFLLTTQASHFLAPLVYSWCILKHLTMLNAWRPSTEWAAAIPVFCSPVRLLCLSPLGGTGSSRGLSPSPVFPLALELQPLPCLSSCCPLMLSPNVISFRKRPLIPDWNVFPYYTLSSQHASHFVTFSCVITKSCASPLNSVLGDRPVPLVPYSLSTIATPQGELGGNDE